MKTAIITGVTSGIGRASSFKLALLGYTKIYLIARNQTKLEALEHELKAEFPKLETVIKTCELSDFQEVQKTALDIQKETSDTGIDLILNNAGVGQGKYILNKQGFEYNLALNYLSQVVLTENLAVNLKTDSFVVFVSSFAYKGANIDFNNMNLESGFSMFRAYANSKAYQMMYVKSLRERFADDTRKIHFEAIHPGVVRTRWARDESNWLFKIFLTVGSVFMISSDYAVSHNVLAPTYSENQASLDKADIWINGKPKTVKTSFMKPESISKLWEFSVKSVKSFFK